MASSRNETKTPKPAPPVTPQTTQVQSRLTWERVMGPASSRVQYEKTCVLLLGWTEENDDTEAAGELEELQKLLEELYRFSVQFKRMHMEKHPQVQATKHVADFVHDEDHPGRLLIVYYGGHGYSEATAKGRIKLAGRFPCTEEERDMSIEWTDVEGSVLAKTKADVLVIFDCCHAGLLCQPAFRGPRRSFQYVAACKAWQRTKSAGPESFSSAMIWALKKLADRPGFTVTKLIHTLMEHEDFPRDRQEAVVYGSRYGPVDEDIWLAPAPKNGVGHGILPANQVYQSSSSGREYVKATADILDLRFHFTEPATASDIEDTAQSLKKLLHTSDDLRFHRITFLDHTSFLEWPVKHWLRQTRRKTGVKGGATLAEAIEESRAAIFEKRTDQRLLKSADFDTTGNGLSSYAMAKTAIVSSAGEVPVGAGVGTNEKSGGGVLNHLGMAFAMLVDWCRPVPAWHSSAFMMVL